MVKRFEGKVVIVTGSSQGIGRATALLFAREGAKVTITGRDLNSLEESKKAILEVTHSEDSVNVVAADVTTSEGTDKIVNSTIEKFGKLDILVNNAGAAFNDENGKVGVEVGIGAYEKTFDINVKCVIDLIQKCRSHLIASKGEVVNVSSIAGGAHANPNFAYYCMSKSALDSMTRCFAIDLIEHGVRVNSVSPGIVATHFLNALGIPDEGVKKCYEYYKQHRDIIPSGGPGKPEEIAQVIGFLADRSMSSYIVGQSIIADGGTSLIMGMNCHDLSEVCK
ncbi:hypothetical protein CAEBREN_24632 [Caenorhabditis brenneri]|uniref:Uncharacterized protein n=1 Tax=Caenorhabditis brenneri TaxID=135651 RepID=G0M909_CAEBE|nr:hypothetical protein CAEBREN_24632 [Caenorhabditis brenneri]